MAGHAATAEIANTKGLHARAAAKFVRQAEAFNAEITVEKDGVTVNGVSIMGLLMLGAGKGTKITVTATGPEADKALKALMDLITRKFDED